MFPIVSHTVKSFLFSQRFSCGLFLLSPLARGRAAGNNFACLLLWAAIGESDSASHDAIEDSSWYCL